MVSKSCFEVIGGDSNVLYGLVICCNFGLIYHAFCEAFTFGRAFVGLSAVGLSRVLCVAYVRLSRVFI